MFSKKISWLVVGVAFVIFMGIYPQGGCAQKVIEFITSETQAASVELQKAWINEFEAKHPEVKVVADFVAFEELETKAVTGVAAGKPPHIVGFDFWMAAMYAKRGLLQPVDDLIEEIGAERYFEVGLECVIDGKIYAVPFALTPTVKYYRYDWYEEAGLVPALTWKNHLENVSKLTKDTDGDGTIDRYGANIVLGSKSLTAERFLENYGAQNGVHYFNEEGELIMDKSPNLERIIELAEWYKELKRYAPPGVASYAWEETMGAYYTGKAAHCDYGGRLLTRLVDRVPELASPTKTRAMLIPYGSHGQYRVGNSVGGWELMKDVKYPEIAKEFLKFITTGERVVDFCLTVPTHLIPPLKEDAQNEKLLNHPFVKTNPDVFREIIRANTVSHTLMYDLETGVHPEVYVLYLEPSIRMVQKMVVFEEEPEKVIKEIAEEIRTRILKQ